MKDSSTQPPSGSPARAITLRALAPDDAARLAALANNKKIWDNMRDYMPYPYTLSDAKKFIKQTLSSFPVTIFGICSKGELCGVIGLNLQQDIYRHSAEIGYWLGEAFWGKGIASQAVHLMLEFGFGELQLDRIFTSVFKYNSTSMRVLEKNGFVLEGIGKKGVLKNGLLWDEHWYALLRAEENKAKS